MAGEKYLQRAAVLLKTYLSEHYNSQISTVNTAQSLSLDEIQTFEAGVRPFGTEDLPRLEVEGQAMAPAEPAGLRTELWDCEVQVNIIRAYADAQHVNEQGNDQAYLTALIDTIIADFTIETAAGDAAVVCEPLEGAVSGETSDKGRGIGLIQLQARVQIHEP